MTRLERWALAGLLALVTLTGIGYFALKHFVRTDDPFAVVNHPWQPGLLALHILAAPIFVLVFGIVFQSHIRAKLTSRLVTRRRSGLTALATFAAMMLSGYALQVVTAERLRTAALATHLATGAIFVVSYLVHLLVPATGRVAVTSPASADSPTS